MPAFGVIIGVTTYLEGICLYLGDSLATWDRRRRVSGTSATSLAWSPLYPILPIAKSPAGSTGPIPSGPFLHPSRHLSSSKASTARTFSEFHDLGRHDSMSSRGHPKAPTQWSDVR
jgi:hypothetical protein